MRSLVSVKEYLFTSGFLIVYFDAYDDIIYQKMSEDWYLLDDSVFAVRIYLLLAS